jgi:hypothetical protein
MIMPIFAKLGMSDATIRYVFTTPPLRSPRAAEAGLDTLSLA